MAGWMAGQWDTRATAVTEERGNMAPLKMAQFIYAFYMKSFVTLMILSLVTLFCRLVNIGAVCVAEEEEAKKTGNAQQKIEITRNTQAR